MHAPTARALRDHAVLDRRLAEVNAPHVYALNTLVREMRVAKGSAYSIPYFDPHDGGTEGEVLFLLEAPGPRAKRTELVSRDNPDETAKNFLELSHLAGLDRRRTILWNIVPWFIGRLHGSKERIRAARAQDIREGIEQLGSVLALLPKLQIAVLVGNKAAKAAAFIAARKPAVSVCRMPHPSPVFVNRSPTENKMRILQALNGVHNALRSEA
jgi:uracil-DNA glycosylase